jgi:hypothetical protein
MMNTTTIEQAERHLSDWCYDKNRPTLLLYLRQRLDAAGIASPKVNAVQAWMDGIIFATADPQQMEAALTPPPYIFEEVAKEAVAFLQQ